MQFLSRAKAFFGAALRRRSGLHGRAKIRGRWQVVCRRPDGTIRWRDEFENLIVNEGLDHALDVTLSNGSQSSNWYVGLLGSSPSPAAGWTKTEVGAADFVDYDEATLPAWTDGGVSSQSVDNSGSKASFTISQDSSTIGGAYLVNANTKAVEGGAGMIYAAGAFSGGDKSADDDDTLEVTATFTAADDGV